MPVRRRKKIEGRKRKLSPVRHQTCIVPSRNHEPSSELLRFVRGVCTNFGQTCQFFYHIILVAWHYINQGFMCFWFFLFFGIKMPCHSMHTYACVHVVRKICLKIPSNLLHMELTRTQVHKYDFSNRSGYALHVDVVQIWITVINWLDNNLNVFKRSNDP